MLHIFDMSLGEVEDDAITTTAKSAAPQIPVELHAQCQLRLLTVAEAEEQRPVPRPRPWAF